MNLLELIGTNSRLHARIRFSRPRSNSSPCEKLISYANDNECSPVCGMSEFCWSRRIDHLEHGSSKRNTPCDVT